MEEHDFYIMLLTSEQKKAMQDLLIRNGFESVGKVLDHETVIIYEYDHRTGKREMCFARIVEETIYVYKYSEARTVR